MVTYADLRQARVTPLRYAAHAWTELSLACAKLEQRCGADLTGPLRSSGWEGPAAHTAFYRCDQLDDEFEVASLRIRTAASVLRQAAEEFEDLQRRLLSAVEAARFLGLVVSDTGRVSAPPIPAAGRNDPDAEPIYRRDVQNASIYGDLIAKLVAEATEADARIARALARLPSDLPGQHAWEYNKTSDGALAAAAALGLSASDIPAPDSDPADVQVWWRELSDDDRQIYLTGYPERIGALDGLPAADRDRANQLVLRNFIGDNVNHGRQGDPQHATALMLLDKLEGAESNPQHKRLYLLSVDPGGDGKAAVSIGNPDAAAHTAVLVPGVGTELDDISGLIRRADRLQDAAFELEPATSDVAVVAWLGYDTPSLDTDIFSAAFDSKSEAGAKALDGFVNGLHSSHDGTSSHVTVIGHSYGSTVLGEAASTGDGLAADDIIAVGSPGMRVDNASEFNVDAQHVWAGAAADDTFVARPEENARYLLGAPIVGGWLAATAVGIHGPAPHNAEFGGNVVQIDTPGHSGYWENGSQSLRSQAAVILGHYQAAVLESGSAP
ncbi:alpha/beta hydrolase [Salinispora oceanensis]|uniref:alpha/beta hydrolase n=1 Tax=Salinispora oceanensis TaxID=1050199 RepID=UPI0003607C01|nr:alpha/beta hydrolase [Salinispora oceanensis]